MTAVIVLLTSAIVFISQINQFPLHNWDEAWYAETIKNMATGNYSLLVPYWNGQYYFDKPPLYFWLSLPIFKFFGPGEWQARTVSVFAAIGASYLTFLIGKKFYGQKAGFLAAFIFLTLGQVAIRFAHGNLDALLTFFTLLAFWCYLVNSQNRTMIPATGAAIGLAILTKGLGPGLFAPFVIGIYHFATKQKSAKSLGLVTLFAGLTVLPYLVAGYLRFSQPFVKWFLASPAAGLFDPATFNFQFIANLLRDIGFWFLPLIWAIIALRRQKTVKIDVKALKILLVPAFIFIFSLNFLKDKLGWYALPAYPLIAIAIAYLITKTNAGKLLLTLVLIAAAIIGQIYNINRIENLYPDRSSIGANLGLQVQKLIPKNATIILDDRDLPTFLFYSNHQKVYVVSPEGNKKGEWWVVKSQELPQFIQENPSSWIITKNPANLPLKFHENQIKGQYEGYYFFKL